VPKTHGAHPGGPFRDLFSVVWKSWGNHVEIPWDESAEIQLKVVCLAT